MKNATSSPWRWCSSSSSPNWRRKGGQVYEPKTSATGCTPAKSPRRTRSPLGRCVSPSRSGRSKPEGRGARGHGRRHQPPVGREDITSSRVNGESGGVSGPNLGSVISVREELAAAVLHLDRRHVDLPDEPEPAHQPDHETADVELPRPQAMERRGGEGVMVVMPRLAERDPGEPPDVPRLVLDSEAARSRRSGRPS